MEPVPNLSEPILSGAGATTVAQRWWAWFKQITYAAAGDYEAVFESGSVQVAGPNGQVEGYGAFQFGFLLPNASGIPSEGILLGGAGITQVVYITDEQIPGQKGINVIFEAGDASATSPATWDGGDLDLFAGGTQNGTGGTLKLQGGTSVTVQGGEAQLVGGGSTSGSPGSAVVEAGQTGTAAGGSCWYIATEPPGAPAYGVHRFQFNSIFTFEFHELGQFYVYSDPSGFGLAGQPLVSGGPSGSIKWLAGFTGTITTAKLTVGGANGSMTFASGILISEVAAT